MIPKFRFWFEEYEQLCPVIYIDFMNRHIQIIVSADGLHEGPLDVYDVDLENLEQFTGIKDARGVDVYEGDIVRWVYPLTGTHQFYGLVVAGTKFEIAVDGWGTPYYSNGFAVRFLDKSGGYRDIPGTFTIIGNIHQNPELLEEKTSEPRIPD